MNPFVFQKLNDFFACFCFGGQKDEKSGLKPKKSRDVGAAGFRLKRTQITHRFRGVKRQAAWHVFLRLLHGEAKSPHQWSKSRHQPSTDRTYGGEAMR